VFVVKGFILHQRAPRQQGFYESYAIPPAPHVLAKELQNATNVPRLMPSLSRGYESDQILSRKPAPTQLNARGVQMRLFSIGRRTNARFNEVQIATSKTLCEKPVRQDASNALRRRSALDVKRATLLSTPNAKNEFLLALSASKRRRSVLHETETLQLEMESAYAIPHSCE
jgi:hypothetical protein